MGSDDGRPHDLALPPGFLFTQRFGLVPVDFDTLVRSPKRSFAWYAAVIRAHHAPGRSTS